MKSRKIILIASLVIISAIGFSTLQDSEFIESTVVDISKTSSESNQIDISESSSEVRTITVSVIDGVGSGDDG